MSIAIRYNSGSYTVCYCLQLCTSTGTRHCAYMQKALQAGVIMPVICTWHSICNEVPTICYRTTAWNQKYTIWCNIQLNNAHLFGHNGSLTIKGLPEISWDFNHFDLHFQVHKADLEFFTVSEINPAWPFFINSTDMNQYTVWSMDKW